MVRGPACWLRDGTQLRADGRPGQTLERRIWPALGLVSTCEVVPWACCNERVAASPRGTLAAVLWWHQTEGAGVELVALDDRQGDRQLNRGYTTWDSNLLGGPAFSPDGRFVAVTEGRQRWWEGGRERGRLTVVDVGTGRAPLPISDDPPESLADDREASATAPRPAHLVASEVLLRPSFSASRIAI